MLASLQRQLVLVLAHRALQTQHNLFRRLGLLVEHGLRLTTVTLLLSIVATLALRKQRRLAGLVLRHFVRRVFSALAALAERVTGLRDVHLRFNHHDAVF